MTEKKYLPKVLAIFMIMLTVLTTLMIPVSASTRGGSGSSTIYVNTKANYWYPGASSITLTQSKQTMTYKALTSSKTKKKTDYFGNYTIRIYNVTKNTSKNTTWGGGKSKKISLDPNCSYRITVSYNSTGTVLFNSSPLGYSYKSVTSPSWNVSSTWKIASYS